MLKPWGPRWDDWRVNLLHASRNMTLRLRLDFWFGRIVGTIRCFDWKTSSWTLTHWRHDDPMGVQKNNHSSFTLFPPVFEGNKSWWGDWHPQRSRYVGRRRLKNIAEFQHFDQRRENARDYGERFFRSVWHGQNNWRGFKRNAAYKWFYPVLVAMLDWLRRQPRGQEGHWEKWKWNTMGHRDRRMRLEFRLAPICLSWKGDATNIYTPGQRWDTSGRGL